MLIYAHNTVRKDPSKFATLTLDVFIVAIWFVLWFYTILYKIQHSTDNFAKFHQTNILDQWQAPPRCNALPSRPARSRAQRRSRQNPPSCKIQISRSYTISSKFYPYVSIALQRTRPFRSSDQFGSEVRSKQVIPSRRWRENVPREISEFLYASRFAPTFFGEPKRSLEKRWPVQSRRVKPFVASSSDKLRGGFFLNRGSIRDISLTIFAQVRW